MTRQDELRAMVADATPGPWLYRPMQHDDWGVVRAPFFMEWGGHPFLCQAYDPSKRDEPTLAAHREAKTDPWEANARLIAQAPTIAAELATALDQLAAARAETERLREALDKAFLAIVEARSHTNPSSLFWGLNDLLGKVDDIRRTALSQEAGT